MKEELSSMQDQEVVMDCSFHVPKKQKYSWEQMDLQIESMIVVITDKLIDIKARFGCTGIFTANLGTDFDGDFFSPVVR